MNNSGKNGFIFEEDTHLTVCKTSRFTNGDGFAVYNSKGQLVFRLDSYGTTQSRHSHSVELVRMDASGSGLLTVCRKRACLHNRWEGFIGERNQVSKPIFSVTRSSSLNGRSGLTVEMYENPVQEYHIEGSFSRRSCTIYDASTKEVMAEIRRKVDASTKVMMMGKDVFSSLLVKPSFDAAFAMGLLLLLDVIATGDSDTRNIEVIRQNFKEG